jgi:hypothetical protein
MRHRSAMKHRTVSTGACAILPRDVQHGFRNCVIISGGLQRVLELDPDFIGAHAGMRNLLRDYESAIEEFEKVILSRTWATPPKCKLTLPRPVGRCGTLEPKAIGKPWSKSFYANPTLALIHWPSPTPPSVTRKEPLTG